MKLRIFKKLMRISGLKKMTAGEFAKATRYKMRLWETIEKKRGIK